jgi:hypothetical protein
MAVWDKASIQKLAQDRNLGYQDLQRLASDVEDVVRELRSLQPKVDNLGMNFTPGMHARSLHLNALMRTARLLPATQTLTVRIFPGRVQ